METFESRIESHQPLVVSLAKDAHRRLPRSITFDDVLSYGQVGLTQAARTFQPQGEAKFSSYAYYRIRGAIYDGIARMNWTSRAEYRKFKAIQRANSVIEANAEQNGDTDPESDARWLSSNVENLAMVYLFSSADSEDPIENQIVADGISPDQTAESNELQEKLRTAVQNLPNDDQRLITMTYFQGLSLAEAAGHLGKSRSWGSRAHTRILKVLSSELLGQQD